MKKMLFAMITTAMILSLSACGSKKAQSAYDAIGSMFFSDESILTADEQARFRDMKLRREDALEKKDTGALEALKSEWEAFSAPIQEVIRLYQEAKDEFFTDEEKDDLTDEERSTAEDLEGKIRDLYQKRDEAGMKDMIRMYRKYGQPIRDIIRTYKNVDFSAFSSSDRNLMDEEEKTEMQDIFDHAREALEHRDLSELESLGRVWSGFVSDTKDEIENTKSDILNQWLDSANLTSSLTNLLSLGTTTTSTGIHGHTITITTQYTAQANASDEQIKNALESYLGLTSYVFQSGVEYLQQYVDDVCIRVEYRNADGNLVASRDFN